MNQFSDTSLLENPYFKKSLEILGHFKKPFVTGKPVVLLDGIMTSTHNSLANITIGLALRELHGCNLAYISKEPMLCHSNQLYQAIGAQHIGYKDNVYANLKPSFFKRLQLSYRIRSLMSNITPEKIIEMQWAGTHIGDLIYDDIVRLNAGVFTLSQADLQILRNHVYGAIEHAIAYENILSSHDFQYAVLSHKFYTSFGILGRLLIRNGVSLISKSSPGINIRKIEKLNQYRENDYRVDRTTLDGLIRSTDQRSVTKYIDDRFAGTLNEFDVINAYTSKKEYVKDAIAQEIDLDWNKPVALIAPHAFGDAPHCDSFMIYEDYYLWFMRTLEIVGDIKHIVWLVKPHPSSSFYNEEGIATDLAERFPYIKIVPRDIRTDSLLKWVDSVITVRGTIGLEAIMFDIKPILAGESIYSGLGLTVDCRSEAEYVHSLSDLKKKEPLSASIKQAAANILYSRNASYHYKDELIGKEMVPNLSTEDKLAHEINNLKNFTKNITPSNLTSQPFYRQIRKFLSGNREKMTITDLNQHGNENASPII